MKTLTEYGKWNMHHKTFYRLTLCLPGLVPLLFYVLSLVVGPGKLSNLLVMSLVFGGVQYLFFAALIFYLIGRLESLKEVKKLFWCSPFIYIIFGTVGWQLAFYVWKYFKPMYSFSVDDAVGPFFFFSIFGLLFGYIYCLIIEFVFQVFKKNKWINTEGEY
ncbi:hypothetical protein [Advenella kashmirensis]|nr:hypothetical protein [Advenella kashmirensis]